MRKVKSYELRVKSGGFTVLRSYGLMVLLLLPFCMAYGQLTTCEKPISLQRELPALPINEKTQKIMPSLDMRKIEQEDKEEEEKGIIPRFGYKHEVHYSLENSGDWITLPDGDKIWRLQIYCPNATSINLLYDRFWLPEGAKFFIYSNDYREQLGAFTSNNNKGKKEDMRGFATGLIRSDTIILEYYLPKEAKDMGIISICDVVHGYRSFGVSENSGRDNESSGFVNINVNCPDAVEWQKEKDAVVVVIVNGSRQCTGALVNTTSLENNTHHYILTAWHCIDNHLKPNLDTWSFEWHYESPGCNDADVPHITTSGATVVADSACADFALLELYEDPAEQWDVIPYYLGWDHSGNKDEGIVVIHHPYVSIKKIYKTNGPLSLQGRPLFAACTSDSYSLWGFGSPTPGYFVGGSSGAPLLNFNHKLIGVHSEMQPQSDQFGTSYLYFFGKFSWAWSGNNTPSTTGRLKDWLDPIGTNPISLEGRGGCQQTIRLWQSYPRAAYHAVQNIISKQTIPSGVTTSYKAGTEIQLIEGFQAKAGSTFSARIEPLAGCGNSQSISFSPSNDTPKGDMTKENNHNLLSQNKIAYHFDLFPNPNAGTFQLETNFPLTEIAQLKITNLPGAPVYEAKTLSSNEIQWQHATDGLYFVVIILKDGTVLTQKMMVQK